jgi:O-antigen ligase
MGLTPLLLLFLILAFLLLGILKDPVWAILGYLTIYLYYNKQVWWGWAIAWYLRRPSLIAVIVLCMACLLHRHRLDWKVSRRELEFYLFLGLCWFVSIFLGGEMVEASWVNLEKISKLFMFIFLFIRCVKSFEHLRIVYFCFFISAMFLSVQAHWIGVFRTGRLDNFGGIDFHDANGFAAFLTFGIAIVAFQLLRARWLVKFLYIFVLAVMINALILTQSRGVFLGILLAGPIIILQCPRKYRKKVTLFALAGAFLFVSLADPGYWERMHTIKAETRYMSSERSALWKASVKIFEDHPLGIGVGNFQSLVGEYAPEHPERDAHSTYVLCYTEIGIFGIILFLLIIIETLFQTHRIRRIILDTTIEDKIIVLLLPIQTTLIVYLLGYMTTHSNLYTEMLWILLALPLCLENATKKLLALESGADHHRKVWP